ncbi:urease accessory UreF family protein [Halomonas sp. I1]|uniref:urease accessory protein UreF n=1 Tax=Halomonas sp. I1 TaxID=393536 RepID=UPI0028DD470E|nr:urease accessory UreF family protein [Halomonas sp. I1]MDT8896231.1 urease accessory UreF family protein [Halomonas sp. I1]
MPTETNPSHRDPLALTGLLQLVSPALPIGAFAWSQGLESAFELGWVSDERSLEAWVQGVLDDGLTRCDLPVLARVMRAWEASDAASLTYWNDWLQANRETRELLEEERRLGAALVRLLGNLALLPTTPRLPESPGYVVMFGLAAWRRGIDEEEALLGFAWAWLENQLAVACKALPLGQTSAQRIIERTRPVLADAVEAASRLPDDDLGPALPGLALASALHETQYSRLFRS